jgi:hypothetical protein
MRRYAAVAMMLGTLSGCFNLDTGPESGGARPLQGQGFAPVPVPGVQGPHGTGVPMAAPYNTAPPPNEYMARMMMRQSIPLTQAQMNAGGIMSPNGIPGFPGGQPAGVGNPMMPGGPGQGPGPGPGAGLGNGPPSDILQAQAMMNPVNAGTPATGQRTQVRFSNPVGMQVSWTAMGPDGKAIFSPTPIETPGKYNFLQGARYRLKLTNLPGRPGVELYPTLEVGPSGPKTEAFLAHNNVPVAFTDEDFKQIADGNYIVKVVYLPDPQFQDVAGTGTDEILSTRLEPGQDPIQEAMRRGSILLVIRMGNIDQEAPNTPPLSAPVPAGPPPGTSPPMKFGPTMPGMMVPPVQVPNWGMGPGGPTGVAPHGVPPGMMPPGGPHGAYPPGMVPPGAYPPGAYPPGAYPPGLTPGGAPSAGPFQSNVPNGAYPPSGPNFGPAGPTGTSPLAPTPLAPPATKSTAPTVPGLDAIGKTPPAADTSKNTVPSTIAAPLTPPSVGPLGGNIVSPLSPGLPPLRTNDADSVTAPARPALPPTIVPAMPK